MSDDTRANDDLPRGAAPGPTAGAHAVVAIVGGKVVDHLPTDLYIPPDALQIFLETFEGPLDLLLYLIRRQNLDILEIKVAAITEQYMRYIELMSALQFDLAGEYLLMASMLAEIKSRMLLPRPVASEEEEDDPRAELIRRLQEYEQFKDAAEKLNEIPRMERDLFQARVARPELVKRHAEPVVDLQELLIALSEVVHRAELYQRHAVHMEPLSVRERMTGVLAAVNATPDFVSFKDLFDVREGRMGVIVTFLAILELIRESLIDIVQHETFAPIYVKAKSE